MKKGVNFIDFGSIYLSKNSCFFVFLSNLAYNILKKISLCVGGYSMLCPYFVNKLCK